MQEELVTVEIKDGVADVRLNRPEKYNALSAPMFKAIIDTGERLRDEKSLRAVVLSGNGRGFCAGLDMQSFAKMGDSDSAASSDSSADAPKSLLDTDGRVENFAQRPALVWKYLQVPVIAALHGVAYGGGAQVALGADIRIAAPDLKMSVMEIKWGLVPDMSITQTLRDILPMDVAKQLTFTGQVLNGHEAQQLGLVTQVADDPYAAAMNMARDIATKSPEAIRAAKQLFETAWHADAKTGLELEAELQAGLIGSANQREAIAANFAKRAPEFFDPE
ncbi:MAG TPA: crotonase/enoyl-CoA hydratase family protein [Gammaproteobacteria bacterium]|nr:enoyl-CoA hydratase [Gammaproteobacteria bacterium]HCY03994.1 crotonase/enoyl-CoA hydratase family protein [Gammaproteobacteria bacterium]|tara:strand:+ start:651 stop:1481 length:831 start_codon:yes stop_codon:yes gene_type:complete